ncbi:DUF4932 domain-containing protein [Proteiniphilum sp.]|uniref:DUF4932 domain-containing protein n=1 Tax=Proteiniphilum sp. TaxID=1926877 RepID=UPI002B213912|nr:DUF4932 domain-containing protein [Proteiniphilum sp.]MEA4916616.1 DUF4932 domain-containing protein [Proteiniphilum sp.]
MRTIILFTCIILSLQSYAGEKLFIESPKVDKRVELLSIVFRLAENKEYNATIFKKYTDRVEKHFNAYKNHELIKFAKTLKENKGISYDAVVSMAVVLDDNLNSMIDFSTTLPEKRWNRDDANKFIQLLKEFYKDAECERFFRENEAFFLEVSNRFSPIYKTIDLNWFQSFYNKKVEENFNIIIGPGCGRQNYGSSYTLPNAKKEMFAIMGIWKVDKSGMPIYEKDAYLPTIIHEFNHSFINPLLAENEEAFEENGKEIYKAVEYEMSQQAYGNWQTMLNEALVRASVIKYFIDHGVNETEIQMMLNKEINNGFIWIKGLVDELTKYDNQRDIYPTLESYMPVLSNAYKIFAEKISQFDVLRPKVKSIAEFINNDKSVSPQIKTITINFDRPLAGKGYSVNYGSKGQSAFPKLDNIYYTNDNKSVIMEVQLTADTEYQFVLTGTNFKTEQGIPLKTYEVNFKTK